MGSDLLDCPAVAVRILEEHEEDAGAELADVARIDAALDELRARGVNVGDDEVQPLHRARRRLDDAGAEADRARGAGRRELHDAELRAGGDVVIESEAELFDVEALGGVHVGDGNRHELELPIHWRHALS